MNIPNGWHIKYNPKPIPDRRNDWDYWHDDADDVDRRFGTAESEEAALQGIMEMIEEEE